jgi:hypothetical protein
VTEIVRRERVAFVAPGGGDGVADLDLSPVGGPLNPPEADEGTVVVEDDFVIVP